MIEKFTSNLAFIYFFTEFSHYDNFNNKKSIILALLTASQLFTYLLQRHGRIAKIISPAAAACAFNRNFFSFGFVFFCSKFKPPICI